MGEQAEMMLDGTNCAYCCCFIDDDGDGFARFCAPCGEARDAALGLTDSTEVVDYEARRRRRGVHSRLRRADATRDFHQARELAEENGLRLVRHSDAHYQLVHVRKNWLTNIYPGNRRLYGDPNRIGPFLHVHHDWTLLDVVRAAVKHERGAEVKR